MNDEQVSRPGEQESPFNDPAVPKPPPDPNPYPVTDPVPDPRPEPSPEPIPGVALAYPRIAINPEFIRTAMAHRGEHRLERGTRGRGRGREVHDAGDPTHGCAA